jgi:OFA family oxalate/formate antiporter-like MFS transporter
LKQNKGNGWIVVFGAVLLQICLGAIYSWSLFNQPLMDKYGWSKDQVVFTYSLAIFVFAATTILSGRLVDKHGPRKIATIGGILYGAGMMLASVASSLPMLYLAYGVLAGMGVGFAYVCPLSTCVKWFPDKKGFITGIAVGAFGAGSMVFKSIIAYFLETAGVSQTFIYLGLIYMVIVVLGAQLLKLPEASASASKTSSSTDEVNLTVKEMFKTKSFYFIWLMFLVGCMPGLLVIGLAKDIGIEMAKLEPAVAANAVGLIALFNAGGRLAWGTISDKLGRIQVVLIMFMITVACLLYMSMVPLSFVSFFVCLSGIACSFGGFLSVFPTITSEFYGVKNLGANYGIIFQAYGIAALIGPVLKANSSGFNQTFLIAAAFAIIGAIFTLMVKKLQKAEAGQTPVTAK